MRKFILTINERRDETINKGDSIKFYFNVNPNQIRSSIVSMRIQLKYAFRRDPRASGGKYKNTAIHVHSAYRAAGCRTSLRNAALRGAMYRVRVVLFHARGALPPLGEGRARRTPREGRRQIERGHAPVRSPLGPAPAPTRPSVEIYRPTY